MLPAGSIYRFILEVNALFLWIWLAQTCILVTSDTNLSFFFFNSCNPTVAKLDGKYPGIFSGGNYMMSFQPANNW